MKEQTKESNVGAEENMIDLKEVFVFLLKKWKTISLMVLLSVLASTYVYISFPKQYEFKAIIFPVQENKGGTSMLGGIPLGLGDLFASQQKAVEGDKIIQLFQSRRTADSIIAELGLEKILRGKTREQNENAILGMIKAMPDKKSSDMITLTVTTGTRSFSFSTEDEDTAKTLGISIANSAIRSVDKIMKGFAFNKSEANANFYKQKMEEARLEKDSAQKKLADFEKENKAIELTEQVKAQIELMANMQVQMFTERLNLDILSQDRLAEDPLVQEAKNKIKLYEKQYSDVLYGRSGGYIIGVDRFSDLRVEYASFFLETKLRTEVYLLLRQMFLKELLQGSKNTPTVEILQPAVAPDRAVNKSKFVHLIISVAVGLFLGVLVVILQKLIHSIKSNPENKEMLDAFKSILNSFLFFRKK